jgi:hypothetical protein
MSERLNLWVMREAAEVTTEWENLSDLQKALMTRRFPKLVGAISGLWAAGWYAYEGEDE